jgi:CBS domain containing-hemolysin-like protein
VDNITTIIITLMFSAFFSGSEMAYLSANKLSIELNRKRKPLVSRIIDLFLSNRNLLISTILVGNNIALVIYGIYMGHLIEPKIRNYINTESTVILLQTIFSTFVILFTGEFLPKIIFRINPVVSLNMFAVPLFFFYCLFYPVSWLTIKISNFLIRKVLRTSHPPQNNEIAIGRIDLDNLVASHSENSRQNDNMPQEVTFFRNALDFSNIKVRECMVPRTDLEATDIDDTLESLSDRFISSGFSRILIYRESIDNIVGYVHISQLFKKPKHLRNVVNPISIVPESMTANKLLEIFTHEHRSIALVVDEFGGTSGIVTLEDVLEEIFGEIDDEHDVSDLTETRIGKNSFRFSGRIEIDYINEKYRLNLPVADDYETLAGMILFYNESIPHPDEEIIIEHFKIKILEASKSKIELVMVTVEK